jgi:hypothetical protein
VQAPPQQAWPPAWLQLASVRQSVTQAPLSQCRPAGHWMPQPPQLLLLVVRSVQTWLQQSEVELTRQTPLPQQTWAKVARQAPLLQGGRLVPRQAHVPVLRPGAVQNCPDGQQT